MRTCALPQIWIPSSGTWSVASGFCTTYESITRCGVAACYCDFCSIIIVCRMSDNVLICYCLCDEHCGLTSQERNHSGYR